MAHTTSTMMPYATPTRADWAPTPTPPHPFNMQSNHDQHRRNQHSNSTNRSTTPPPLPPPPRDLPEGYRASTGASQSQTDNMPGVLTRTYNPPSIEERSTPPSSPNTDRPSRRNSFGFLPRSKSRTRERFHDVRNVPTVTAADGHKMLRKQKLRHEEERIRQQREARDSQPPPMIPSQPPLPAIHTFGGEGAPTPYEYSNRPDSVAILSNKTSNFSRPYQPVNMPQSTSLPILSKQTQQPPYRGNGAVKGGAEYVHSDMVSEGFGRRQHSVASTTVGNINSPRRVRRRKDPTSFNVLIIGAKNSGKTSFVDFLRNSFAAPYEKSHASQFSPQMTTTDGNFTSHYLETDLEGERVGLTLWDSQGLERNMVDLQLREMISFVESKFEETFAEEQKVQRTPGAKDAHIHCVFLVLDPLRLDMTLRNNRASTNGNGSISLAGLDHELDLQVIKQLSGKTTVVPVISKADTLTAAHMNHLKRGVWTSIQAEKLDPLEALGLEEESEDEHFEPDSDDANMSSSSSDAFPIQSTSSSNSDLPHNRHREYEDASETNDNFHPGDSSSPEPKTTSSATTPSPGQPLRRPHSRAASRTLGSEEVSVTDMYIPFTIISPDPYDPDILGRRFPWGIADPHNPDHCDFVRLRDSVFAEWRTELRTAAREKWYENWRTSRLKKTPQRIRQADGVTPIAAVPKEGRSASGGAGGVSGMSPPSGQPTGLGVYGADGRPRTAIPSKVERAF